VAAFCYELTDETFGVHSLRFARGENAAPINAGHQPHLPTAWVAGTVLGVLAVSLITDVKPFRARLCAAGDVHRLVDLADKK